jgi:hypothetical protein
MFVLKEREISILVKTNLFENFTHLNVMSINNIVYDHIPIEYHQTMSMLNKKIFPLFTTEFLDVLSN